jgi:hypothetical protein
MKLYQDIFNYLKAFNLYHSTAFKFDTIRVIFNKRYKLDKLKEIGKWSKLTNKSNLYQKLIKRLTTCELTSVYRLDNENIYYFNYSNPPKYRKAMLVVFGITQYHKEPPSLEMIETILNILKSIDEVDICYDTPIKPNIDILQEHSQLIRYSDDTYYVNQTNISMIDKIVIYNKQAKNRLSSPLWRIEATISIPNPKYLALPLYEFKRALELMEVA